MSSDFFFPFTVHSFVFFFYTKTNVWLSLQDICPFYGYLKKKWKDTGEMVMSNNVAAQSKKRNCFEKKEIVYDSFIIEKIYQQ